MAHLQLMEFIEKNIRENATAEQLADLIEILKNKPYDLVPWVLRNLNMWSAFAAIDIKDVVTVNFSEKESRDIIDFLKNKLAPASAE